MASRKSSPATWTVPITDYVKATTPAFVASAGSYQHVFATIDALSAATFADYSGVWQELRILAMKLQWVPQCQNAQLNSSASNATLVDSFPMFICPYRGNNSTLTSAVQAVAHKPMQCKSLNQPQQATIKMDESDEAAFVSTSGATVPAVFGFKVFWSGTSGLVTTPVFNLGYFIVTWLVQFRGLVDGNTQARRKPPVVDASDERKEVDDVCIVDGPALAQTLREYAAAATAAVGPVRRMAPLPTRTAVAANAAAAR